jgi:hypothetical protein
MTSIYYKAVISELSPAIIHLLLYCLEIWEHGNARRYPQEMYERSDF